MRGVTTSPGAYLAVFAALVALTALTVGAAYVDLGPLNVVVAITIAIVKAALILWFFMHLRESAPLVWLYAGAGFVWLLLLLALTLNDPLTRGWP